MESKDIKARFDGFGPITQSKTTHIGGFGREGSFAPSKQHSIRLRSDRNLYQPIEDNSVVYPFQLSVVNVAVAGANVSKIRIQYGEIDGVPPNGLTLNNDYLLEPGNSFIYLIVTFDGDGRISSRTIGFDDPVPDDTNDTKHIVLGEVSYAGGLYEIVNQNIAQDIYPEKALVVDRSNASFVYSLFADPRKINAIYELENFNVNLDGDNSTTTLYLKSQDNAEYLELKKDSNQGECSVYGYSGSNAQNFILSSNDTSSISKLELFDTGNANFFTTRVDSTSKVSARGYSNNEEQNFLIEADSTAGTSKVILFDSGSANYLETKVDTDAGKTSVYGYTGSTSEYFLLQAQADDTKLYLQEGSDNSTLHPYSLVINNSLGSTGTYEPHQLTLSMSSGDQSYLSTSALLIETSVGDGTYEPHQLTLRDSNGGVDANTAEIKTYKSTGAFASLFSDGTLSMKDAAGTTINMAVSSLSGHNATWREIDICDGGTTKKMKVLGTAPY